MMATCGKAAREMRLMGCLFRSDYRDELSSHGRCIFLRVRSAVLVNGTRNADRTCMKMRHGPAIRTSILAASDLRSDQSCASVPRLVTGGGSSCMRSEQGNLGALGAGGATSQEQYP